MSRRVYIRLNRSEVDALSKLAELERRHPADQGALLLTEALKRAGALPSAPLQATESTGGTDGSR
jgi:hypothetical protein